MERPHLIEAQLIKVICGRRERVAREHSSRLSKLQASADSNWPSGDVDIRDEYTSDMSYHGTGNGRLIAERRNGKWSVL